jgi:hypothetical protein
MGRLGKLILQVDGAERAGVEIVDERAVVDAPLDDVDRLSVTDVESVGDGELELPARGGGVTAGAREQAGPLVATEGGGRHGSPSCSGVSSG